MSRQGAGWIRWGGGLLWTVLVLAACAGGTWRGGAGDPATVTFAEELEVELDAMEETPSGLYIQQLTPGTGPVARRNSLVTIHYITWLPDGTVVDSSLGGEPFTFRLGEGEVIRGWNQGIPGMQRGERRKLVVRPGLAYGSAGSARVPPDATLVFELQLLDVR